MTQLILALTVGILFACGAYLVMRRGQIKLILGLGLLSHGVNLLLFGSGRLTLGQPPIFADKQNFLADLARGRLADPLPQALILTAIVISFGITAFVIVLVNRRHTITNSDVVQGELVPLLVEGDPFGAEIREGYGYDWLAYEVDEVYERGQMDARGSRVSPDEDESAALEREGYDQR
ncbi:MAG: Na+/H+ antiporter subunit C [Chloroflexi bacterium]|nr:Na+/H+ antiporter subunit C [Chloroflexota bacterium]